MADVVIPGTQREADWLDRSIAVPWARITALAAHWELIAYAALFLAGFLLRFWDVGSRAMHHDESLHAYYAWRFFIGQGYSYDPLMHGPLQFEVAPVFYLLFGAGEMSARFLAVVLGTVMIALPYFLRSHISRPGALLVALMLTVSPAFVYFSRFIRDDIYLACFSLILFVVIVRYLDTPRPYLVYIAAAAAALAMASMEAAYITFFIFGTFLLVEAAREYLGDRQGPLLRAVRQTPFDTWLTALSIFVVLNVLLYSTFFTNPYGIWDTQHGFWSPERKDILGGLLYWKAQHSIQRGGQPWFYYLLVLPLYEQLAVLFGFAGIVYAFVRRSVVATFLVWWAVMSYALYSWAGEKMPWLSIHIALPLILLAGLFLGNVLASRRSWLVIGIGSLFAVLLAVEIHSTFVLNYVDGANPTEMLIYVQTSQDVPNTVTAINTLSRRIHAGNQLQIGLDNSDVGGWPFTWYLRDYSRVSETSSFSGPACGGQYCQVLLMLGPEFDQYGPHLMKRYVAQKYRWNWWFPEDYKIWFPQHWGDALAGRGSLLSNLLGTSQDWHHVWNWMVYRTPFGDRGARWMYVLVRRDLVPGSKNYATTIPGAAGAVGVTLPHVPAVKAASIAISGIALAGPRGLAAGPNGDLYVADTLNHRVVHVVGTRSVGSWGSPGAEPGQFSLRDSPMGAAVGPDGNVYVADTWNQRIQVFSPGGRFLRQWGSPAIGNQDGQFYGPRSVAVSSSGRVYVADTGNRRIQVFDSRGKFLFTWGTSGTGPGQFQEPSSVAVGPTGMVYVADFWNQRIQEFTASGAFVRSWAVSDWTAQSYDEPYITTDRRTGNVFATDPQQQQVLVYTATGRLLGSFGSSQFTLPIGVAALTNGRIAVGDATNNRVDLYRIRIDRLTLPSKRPSSAAEAKKP